MSMGAMPESRRDDPFLAPGSGGDDIDLTDIPSRAAPTLDITPPPRLLALEPQKPLKYKKPGTSWVTVVVLAFAAVGMAAVGGTALKKIFGAKDRTAEAAIQEAQALRYSSL